MTESTGSKIIPRHLLQAFHFKGGVQLLSFPQILKLAHTFKRMNILNQNGDAPR